MDASDLVEALRDLGHQPRAYSGRGMDGRECIGVSLEDDGHLWSLANDLGVNGHDVPQPRTDSLGKGIIAYWPRLAWPSQEN